MAVRHIQALKDVAKAMKEATIALAPEDTGNLKSKIKSYNTYDRMIKYDKNANVQVLVDFSPPGAEYGEWFNDPPAVKSERRKKLRATAKQRGNWNFGYRAIQDKSVNQAIKQFQKAYTDDVKQRIKDALNS